MASWSKGTAQQDSRLPDGAPLPKTSAALQVFDRVFLHGVPQLAKTVSAEAASAVDASVADLLETSVRTTVNSTVQALRDQLDDPAVQEAGGRFITAVVVAPGMKKLLLDLGTSELLVQALRRHLGEQQVQNQVQWALLQLQGEQPIISMLQQADALTLEAVRASVWCLASHIMQFSIDAVGWERREGYAGLATLALRRFPNDPSSVASSLQLLGHVYKAQARDSQHAKANEVIQIVFEALQAHKADFGVLRSSMQCLVNLVEGNAVATEHLRKNGPQLICTLVDLMQKCSGEDTVLKCVARVYYAVAGATGLLEAMQCPGVQGQSQQSALLSVFREFAEEADVDSLLRLNAVSCVCNAMEMNPAAAVSTLGLIAEFYLQYHASLGSTLDSSLAHSLQTEWEKSITAIVTRLAQEIEKTEKKRKNNLVYAEALIALRNVSRRSSSVADRICQSTVLNKAVDLAFERDFFDLTFNSLLQLVGAYLFFSGMAKLQGQLDKYPDAPIFHEAACQVLVEAAEEEEGDIIVFSTNLAFYATEVLTKLALKARNAEALVSQAVQLQGHVLGHVSPGTFLPERRDVADDAMPAERSGVLEDGLLSLLGSLQRFPGSAEIACEVCCAMVRVAEKNFDSLRPILASNHAVEALQAIVHRFPHDVEVLSNVAVAVGVLGGASQVFAVLDSAANSLSGQKAACRALALLCRMGLHFRGQEEQDQAKKLVSDAQAAFAKQEQWELQAETEVTFGLIEGARLRFPSS